MRRLLKCRRVRRLPLKGTNSNRLSLDSTQPGHCAGIKAVFPTPLERYFCRLGVCIRSVRHAAQLYFRLLISCGHCSYSITLPRPARSRAGTGYTFSMTGTGSVNVLSQAARMASTLARLFYIPMIDIILSRMVFRSGMKCSGPMLFHPVFWDPSCCRPTPSQPSLRGFGGCEGICI